MCTGKVKGRANCYLKVGLKEAVLYRLCQVLAACEKLTSVSVSGENAQYSLTPFWKILPAGLTSLKISDRCLDLDLDCLLQLDKLRELSINGYVMAAICRNPKDISNKVASLILRHPEAISNHVASLILRHPECCAEEVLLVLGVQAALFISQVGSFLVVML